MSSGKPAYYTSIAPLYNLLKAEDNYTVWASLITQILKGDEISRGTLLDVGCGTGLSTAALRQDGWQVSGVDISLPMLEVARGNPTLADTVLRCADMRSLPVDLGTFDVVNWSGEVVNHLLKRRDVAQAFNSSFHMLNKDGRLCFDVNTVVGFEELFATSAVIRRPDVVFIWQVDDNFRGLRPGCLARSTILAFSRSDEGDFTLTEGEVVERHYPHELLLQLLTECGFGEVEYYGLHGAGRLERPSDAHAKWIYSARKL